MRKIATLLTALVVVMLLLPMPAALARSAERFSYGERVDFAGAGWLAETDYSTTNLEIRVFDLDY
ncbi:MAG: hypothetical protein OEZ14_13315, partial [Acidimicrobiia bacterium]|nr:hypothetical protein [Acidimicrobiia bacterium]